MKPRTDQENLLTDVLDAEAEAGFSAAVLAETLRGARRRRRVRQIRRYGALVALFTVAVVVSNHFFWRGVKPELALSTPPVSYQLVVSRPLSPSQIVTTQPLRPIQQVASMTTAQQVRTSTGGFGEIGDDELMALAAPRVVALVRRGPHEAELVFVSSSPENSDSRQN